MGPLIIALARSPSFILRISPDDIPIVGIAIEDLPAAIALDLNLSVLTLDHAFLLPGNIGAEQSEPSWPGENRSRPFPCCRAAR